MLALALASCSTVRSTWDRSWDSVSENRSGCTQFSAPLGLPEVAQLGVQLGEDLQVVVLCLVSRVNRQRLVK